MNRFEFESDVGTQKSEGWSSDVGTFERFVLNSQESQKMVLKMGKMNLENAQEFIAETEKEFELGNFNAFTDVVADGDDDDQLSAEDMKKELTNCIYLQDASVELYGLKFYGTPWQPEFGGWAFNLPRGQVRLFFRFLEEKKAYLLIIREDSCTNHATFHWHIILL